MISDLRLEQALCFLAETDQEFASAKGAMLRAEHMAKVAEALAFKGLTGPIEERKRSALLEPAVVDAHEEAFRVAVLYESLRAKRSTNEIVIEVWRSINANRRGGLT